jgi:hypothetical protein
MVKSHIFSTCAVVFVLGKIDITIGKKETVSATCDYSNGVTKAKHRYQTVAFSLGYFDA